jgi:signal transduction histidine kinase
VAVRRVAAHRGHPQVSAVEAEPVARARVALTLSYMDDEIALDVADDGRGFEPAVLTGPSGGRGFGLGAMRSRAEQLGGRFAVEFGAGDGTAVAVTFPLAGPVGAW